MVAGVDGCRAGWAVQTMDDNGRTDFALIRNGDTIGLEQLFDDSDCTYIDMPMGLAGPAAVEDPGGPPLGLGGPPLGLGGPPLGLGGPPLRVCDLRARALLVALGGRSSSVFPVPERVAVFAAGYREACELQRLRTGKSIPLQTWHIVPKIRSLDHVMSKRTDLCTRVFESHPEICFGALSPNGSALPKKRTPEGIAWRIGILERFIPSIRTDMNSIVANRRRAQISMDDILDAAILCVAAARATQSPSPSGMMSHILLPIGDPQIDSRGIPARIAVPDTPNVQSVISGS
jgi:predicted RNase H-like nuclease